MNYTEPNPQFLHTLIDNLPGMAYRCRDDENWTMLFVSAGAFELTGYHPAELIENRVVGYGDLIHSADREQVGREVRTALAKRQPFKITYRITTAGGAEKWVWEQGRGIYSDDGDLEAIEGFISDVTPQTNAQLKLYEEAERRADENQTLLSVHQALTSHLDLAAVLQLIADEARRLTNARISSVYLLEGKFLRLAVISGTGEERANFPIGYRFPVDNSIFGQVVTSGKSIFVPDVSEHPGGYPDARRRLNHQAAIIVPMISGTVPVGGFSVIDKLDGEFNAEDERVLTTFAAVAAIAVDNARLYEEEQERREVAEGLRGIMAILNSDRPVGEILDYTMNRAQKLLGASAGLIYRLEDAGRMARLEATWGLDEELQNFETVPLYRGSSNRAISQRQPYAITDFAAHLRRELPDTAVLPPAAAAWLNALASHYQAHLNVPLIVREEVYGGLQFYYPEPRSFSTEDIELGATLGEHVSLAIENARLRDRAEEAAAATERNRLARDLHDAVTQTLFSASLIADVLPEIWESDPQEGKELLNEIRQLSRGALAEMRTLLLELRPESLVKATWRDLLRQLAEATTGRTGVPVQVTVEEEGKLPAPVQVALYRIAQEAFNNIAKHARASHVTVSMRCDAQRMQLRVCDDGCGFDLDGISAEHLGLSIMRERAESVGAELRIASCAGEGTEIVVNWCDS